MILMENEWKNCHPFCFYVTWFIKCLNADCQRQRFFILKFRDSCWQQNPLKTEKRIFITGPFCYKVQSWKHLNIVLSFIKKFSTKLLKKKKIARAERNQKSIAKFDHNVRYSYKYLAIQHSPSSKRQKTKDRKLGYIIRYPIHWYRHPSLAQVKDKSSTSGFAPSCLIW